MSTGSYDAIDQIPPITRDGDARELATYAYDRMLALLDQLNPDDWGVRTECPAWTVADMVGHLIGAARGHASLRELVRQQTWALRHKREYAGNTLDAMNALQVREHADLAPAERVMRLREIAPAAVEGRMRLPGLLRRLRIPLDPGGSTAAGMPDRIRLGHLMDTILTRDVWLHRIDIARAVGREVELTPAADGRIVADVVAEWAARHGQPVDLVLTGPAGGRFRQGEGAERLEMDAIEFCRVLSGRASGDWLLGTRVVF
ncbi:MAG: maleylpyruvate isomerase family mycothiol-dependent enzyme [Actinomycetota bacterium]